MTTLTFAPRKNFAIIRAAAVLALSVALTAGFVLATLHAPTSDTLACQPVGDGSIRC
jgi:hypothetical protein